MADQSDEDLTRKSQFTRRSVLLGCAQAAGFGLIGWRLYDLQVANARRYAPMAEDNRLNVQVLTPKRGRILDAFGRVLADNEELFRVTITPALAKDVGAVLQRVGQIVPLTNDRISRIVARTRKQNRNLPTTIASDLSFEQVAKLNLYAPSLPGVKTDFAWRRRYRDGAALSHVVGFVGSVERFGIDDDAVIRIPDIRIGKSGAEQGFDAALRGTAGTQKSEVDARGRVVRNIETVDPIAGKDVRLALDGELQRRVVERMQRDGLASVVVLDIATGEIPIMASVPGFDPAQIASGISEADWTKLSASDDKPLLNRAVAGLYTPGSTFLIVTALAALDAGVVSLDERVTCNGRYEYGGQIYRCSNPKGHGNVNLQDAISASCEVFFCEMSARLGIKRIAAAARAMGLGATNNIGLADEKAGIVPDRDWKRGNLNAGWLGGETLLTGIGRGYLQVTPLQLAVVAARMASGRAVAPVLRLPEDPASRQADAFSGLPFRAEAFEPVRRGMTAAVNDAKGSATAARLGNALVAGKTGVSEIGARSTDNADRSKRNHALFVGYEPVDAPRYAIATVIEHASDSTAAAVLARDALSLIIARDDHDRNKSGADGRAFPRDGRTQEAG
ncbi:MAG: penicillin-binding protein 2 [Proteobacteria bacterium]|nr:penicillin-binding protein 2 [Pseudomonadota bacterium]